MNKKVFGILLGTAALLLVSCQNFLKGQETADQIQAAIAYANADFTLIKVQPQKGTGIVVKPAGGEAHQKPTDVFDLVFEPSSDYEFVTWEVSCKNKPIDDVMMLNYIEIEDPNKAETTVTFRRPLEDIIITPVVVRRPKILSYSPIYTGSLSFKDSKIQVIFDRKMHPSSIYYSLDEINELKAELGLRDQDFLPENAVPGMTDIYGYKKNGEYIYKNILIKNNDEQTNINNRFSAPYFESPTTLIIPANKDLLPENYSFISVSIDKSFCYEVEYENMSKKIGLFESKDWVYQVNNQKDDVPPKISGLEIKKKNKDNQEEDLQILPSNTSFSFDKWSQDIKKLNEKKIYIKFSAGDEGSGLAPYFDVELNRFLNNNYEGLFPNNTITTLKTYYTSIGRDSEYEGIIDLSNYPEGVYTLNIYLYDNNGKTLHSITTPANQGDPVKSSAYFIIDDNVHISEPQITDDSVPNGKVIISWAPPNDLKSIDIKYSKDEGQTWTPTNQITDIFYKKTVVDNEGNETEEDSVKTSTIIESLESNTTYTFEITFTDWSGNKKTFTKRKLTRKDCTPVIERMSSIYSGKTVYLEYSFTRAPLSQERIYLVCSASPDFSSEVKKYFLNSNESQAYFNYEESLKNYSYFKICVYWENDPNEYTSSARWRKSAAGTLHFWQE